MSEKMQINRREFIHRSAIGGAAVGMALEELHGESPDPIAPVPANEKITVGVIGVGARSHELMQAIMTLANTEIVGVCDAYTGRVERAVARTKGRAKIYKDYREILADKSIDTVVIATPDHWHATMAVDALRAGKDVYIEKPLTYTVEEGNTIISEVKKSGRILQVGSQGMSSRIQQKARELIASGKLGQVTMIRAFYNRNTAGGAWIYPIPPDASPATVNWEMFLGPAPKRPVDYARFFRWRCYQDYSGGISTDLFVHLCTSIHFMMNAKMPAQVVAMGQLYRWKESRDVPDTINAILEYPEGFTANLSSTFNNQSGSEGGGFQILGTKGSLVIGGSGMTFNPEITYEDNRWIVESWASGLQEAYYKDPKVRTEELPGTREPEVIPGHEQYREIGLEATVIHFRNFFSSVKTRKPPMEDALAGHRAASCAHLINRSAREKKMVSWDSSRETLKT
jgi:predicted dehydrogenase